MARAGSYRAGRGVGRVVGHALGRSGGLTVRCARQEGGRSRPSERQARPKPASAVGGQSIGAQRATRLTRSLKLLSRAARATASRRASRRARIATGCGATSHPTPRGQLGPMPSNRAATAGAAASGASAEPWPPATYEALARGAVAAEASPGFEPPPPAGAGHGAAIDHVCSSRSPRVRGGLIGWPPRARTRRRTCPAGRGGLAEDTVRPASRQCRPIARSDSGNEPSANT